MVEAGKGEFLWGAAKSAIDISSESNYILHQVPKDARVRLP